MSRAASNMMLLKRSRKALPGVSSKPSPSPPVAAACAAGATGPMFVGWVTVITPIGLEPTRSMLTISMSTTSTPPSSCGVWRSISAQPVRTTVASPSRLAISTVATTGRRSLPAGGSA